MSVAPWPPFLQDLKVLASFLLGVVACKLMDRLGRWVPALGPLKPGCGG